jgi:endonuclease/exonuclease/phosphatase family metal-dependent hydrolase
MARCDNIDLRCQVRGKVRGKVRPAAASALRAAFPFAALLTACTPPAAHDASAPAADTLTVIAYNIHHAEGMDSVVDLQRIAALINAEAPDLIAIQEVDDSVTRTGGVDQARILGDLTGMTPVFGAFMPYQGGDYGMAVLSRWPVIESANLRLPDGDEPRTALAVRVRSPRTRQELLIVGIHFYRTDKERLAQATTLDSLLADEQAPILLAGDYNSLPESEVMAFFAEEWTIVSKGADRLTFPSWDPQREIDYFVYRPVDRFELVEQRLLDEPIASDHRPLVARFVLRPQ